MSSFRIVNGPRHGETIDGNYEDGDVIMDRNGYPPLRKKLDDDFLVETRVVVRYYIARGLAMYQGEEYLYREPISGDRVFDAFELAGAESRRELP